MRRVGGDPSLIETDCERISGAMPNTRHLPCHMAMLVVLYCVVLYCVTSINCDYDDFQQLTPSIVWSAQSFHFEDAENGDENDAEKRVKVITHSATKRYAFNLCRDTSAQCRLGGHALTKLRLLKSFALGDAETKRDYRDAFRAFCDEHHEDEFQHVVVELEFADEDFKYNLVCVKGEEEGCWNTRCYALWACLCCAPCFRMRMHSRMTRKTYALQKEMTILPMFVDR